MLKIINTSGNNTNNSSSSNGTISSNTSKKLKATSSAPDTSSSSGNERIAASGEEDCKRVLNSNLNGGEDKLSLLVKAAEVVRDEANKTAKSGKSQNHDEKAGTSSHNFTTLSAFVNSASSFKANQHERNSSTSSNSSNLTGGSEQNATNGPTMFIGKNGKPTRPFKAYPKEPLSLTASSQLQLQQQQAQASVSTPSDLNVNL